MRIITDRFTFGSDINLSRFAERTVRETCPLCAGEPVAERLNGRPVGRCGLCKGAGTLAVAQIACDDCGQFHDVEALQTWHVGPVEDDPKDHIWSVLCGVCCDLTREAWLAAIRRQEAEVREAVRAERGYVFRQGD